MSILLGKLPESLEIQGESYDLNTDFRTWIRFESLFTKSQDDGYDAFANACILCFRKTDEKPFKLPPSYTDTLKGLLAFYCGKSLDEYEELAVKKADGSMNNEKSQRIYDFEFDSDYIYAAFMQQYGIDLCQTDMHWWKFKALFAGLTDGTKIADIMQVRAVDLSKIKDKEQKARYIKLKDLYSLPDLRSEEEKENDMASALW